MGIMLNVKGQISVAQDVRALAQRINAMHAAGQLAWRIHPGVRVAPAIRPGYQTLAHPAHKSPGNNAIILDYYRWHRY